MPTVLSSRLAVAWLLSACTVAWAHTTALDRPQYGLSVAPPGYRRAVVAYEVPPVTLQDVTGTAVLLSAVLQHDGPVLLQFVYTTCSTTCPVMSGIFAALQEQFSAELAPATMLSISIDPEHDTPARLQAYARQFNARPQWRFLTGRRHDIVTVQKAFDAYRGSKMLHQPTLYVRVSPVTPWVRFDGLLSVADLITEYRRLLAP